jgi:hypothetical protein
MRADRSHTDNPVNAATISRWPKELPQFQRRTLGI